jgi:hypothetical protein
LRRSIRVAEEAWMTCSFLNWQRRPAWCAISVLVAVLVAGETTRPRAFSWNLLVPVTSDPAPVEETESADEVLLAKPRHRVRCRSTLWPLAEPCLLAWNSHCPGLLLPSLLRHTLVPEGPLHNRGLPLRC